MAGVTFALGIPHTPWVPERVESLRHLERVLGTDALDIETSQLGGVICRLFTDKAANWEWSQKLWGWACSTEATHLLQLQDDCRVGPEFWSALRAMVEAKPDDVIGLESVLSVGQQWYSTSDGLIGVAYVVPIPALRDFLTWRATQLRGAGYKLLNEDQQLGLWCFATGRRVLHPSVTIVDHDTDLPSTYGNDRHTYRKPAHSSVRGDKLPESWAGEPFHVGRFYSSTPRLARQWVKGYSWRRMMEDSRKP
jgi:hypothetical protein